MLGEEYSEAGAVGDVGESSLEGNTRKRKNNRKNVSLFVEEIAQKTLESGKEQVEIIEKLDKEYPGMRNQEKLETYMVPCTFVDKGKKNPKNGAAAEREIFKTLHNNCSGVIDDDISSGLVSSGQPTIDKFFPVSSNQTSKDKIGPAFVFHGQKHEGTEFDFIKVDMTGVTIYECKGITRAKQAQGTYDDACSQLNESIPKLNLDDDIPVNRVVALPLCQHTKINLDGNIRALFKEDCERATFNKWLLESYRKKYFSEKNLTFDRYLEVVQKFLLVYHSGGNFSEYKRRVVSDTTDCLERETKTFYTKEQAEVMHADISQNMWIQGCAGSGKTFLLKKRVSWLISHDHEVKKMTKPVILVVTYNRPIKLEIKLSLKEEFGKGVVRVQTFRALLCHILQLCKKTVKLNDSDVVVLVERILSDPNHLLKYFKRNGMSKYRHILIDESQDLSGEWLKLMRNLLNQQLKNTCSIWVFVDSYQVVRRGIKMPGEDQKKDFQERSITKVIRNTVEVFDAYKYCFENNSTASSRKPTVAHGVYGMPPEYICTAEDAEEDLQNKVLETLKKLQEKRVSLLDIAVITQGGSDLSNIDSPATSIREFLELNKIPCTDAETGTRKRHYKRKPNDPPVIVDTVQRFKGLEAKVLIFCIVRDWEPRDVDLYVGFSRAFCHLITIGKSRTINAINNGQKKVKRSEINKTF